MFHSHLEQTNENERHFFLQDSTLSLIFVDEEESVRQKRKIRETSKSCESPKGKPVTGNNTLTGFLTYFYTKVSHTGNTLTREIIRHSRNYPDTIYIRSRKIPYPGNQASTQADKGQKKIFPTPFCWHNHNNREAEKQRRDATATTTIVDQNRRNKQQQRQ